MSRTSNSSIIAVYLLLLALVGVPMPVLISPSFEDRSSTAYALMFLMAMTTFPAAARALGPRNWRRLHKTGLYFIGAIFVNALSGDIVEKPTDPYYLAAAILIVLAITIRATAFIREKNQRTAAIESER